VHGVTRRWFGQALGGALALGGAAGLAACGPLAEPGRPEAGGASDGAPSGSTRPT
jgi:hypothetical protein